MHATAPFFLLKTGKTIGHICLNFSICLFYSRRDSKKSPVLQNEDDCNNESDYDEVYNVFRKKGETHTTKKRVGRKAQWPESLLADMLDIIVTNDYFKRQLIFVNSKNQKNGEVYLKVLDQLIEQAKTRGEEVPFNATQLRTKFKKIVGECKKAALVMKTSTGIRRFQEEHGYGAWFDQLFALVKTRDSCQPEQPIEPSQKMNEASSVSISNTPASEPGSSSDSPDFFVPLKKTKKVSNVAQMQEVIGMLKKVVEDDPMKAFLEFAREEADKARQHEMQLFQLIMGQNQQQPNNQNFPVQSTPQRPGFYNYIHPSNSDTMNEDLTYYQL